MNRQNFKSIYFTDKDLFGTSGRSVTVSFSEKDSVLKDQVQCLSNEEIRELIGMQKYQDLVIQAKREDRTISQFIKLRLKRNLDKVHSIRPADVTFRNSKQIPFQRWYPYTEGYSPDFVTTLLEKYCSEAKIVFDPFAGTGTTFFAADLKGLRSFYSEVNPFLVFLAKVKIQILLMNKASRLELLSDLERISANVFKFLDDTPEDLRLKNNYCVIFGKSKYYDDLTFSKILRLRCLIDRIYEEKPAAADALEVSVLSILLKVSCLKKAGDVRFKTAKERENEIFNIDEELALKIKEMLSDIANLDFCLKHKPEFLLYNSKKIGLLQHLNIDAVITSPPYLNGTNYLRNTKIELWFLRCLQEAHDLRGYRDQIVTSGINDVRAHAGESLKELNDIESPLLKKTLKELKEKTYDHRIPIMIDSYFHEMHSVFNGLKKHLSPNSRVLIDIGDSIFAGVHVKTDDILIEVLGNVGYQLIEKVLLRKRRSRDKSILSQVLLVFQIAPSTKPSIQLAQNSYYWKNEWVQFKKTLPHQKGAYLKKNWGHPNHSLCSYGGKLKPAIAHFLVKTFVPEGGFVFDPFSGVGTIPFEAALNGRKAFGLDISAPAYYISAAKVSKPDASESFAYLGMMRSYIDQNQATVSELQGAKIFGFNKKISDYFEETTLKELLLARRFIAIHPPQKPSEMYVIAALLHVLHGNRPYALSRRSHPITPYAPTGEFEYRNVCQKVADKLDRVFGQSLPDNFTEGEIYWHDATTEWPQKINNLNAVITSPPFFESTRFYLANWMRLWLCGWNLSDFKTKPAVFVEERQRLGFEVYENIYRQARERLRSGGVLVFHLGQSKKCNMAEKILETSKRYFSKSDLFSEHVGHCQSHGIRDKGAVTSHQYLVLQ